MSETQNVVEIAPAGDPGTLAAEIGPESCIGSFMDLSLHILNGWEKPACMAEIGRIREREFRAVGAGRNVTRDIDALDTTPDTYRQLISWDPQRRELVSMYRFAETARIVRDHGLESLRTFSLFEFSSSFTERYLPCSVELGRSVVNSRAARAVAGLFAVWRGLGVLANEVPGLQYFFGNVTLPASMPADARDFLLRFLHAQYSSDERRAMVRARAGLDCSFSTPAEPISADRAEARDQLIARFSSHGLMVPPILLSYMGASDDMHVFDTARDPDFGDAWETALAVPVGAVNAKTRRRFVDGYKREPEGYFAHRT